LTPPRTPPTPGGATGMPDVNSSRANSSGADAARSV